MDIIFNKGKDCLDKKMPFVIYCKPNSDKLIGVFQKNDNLFEIDSFEETGFAFVSFDGKKKYLIPRNESDVYIETINEIDYFIENEIDLNIDLDAKTTFENLVEKGVKAIQNNQFDKVVLSRKEILKIDNFDFGNIFNKLIFNYPNTFKYCFYHQKIGFWIGATPEQFLQSSENTIKTVSFAGTQPYSETEEYIWQEKEKQEQQFVTDFILTNLKKYSTEISFSEPYTFRAGSIVHIKTDIEATMNTKNDFRNIIEKLHPTPAVCGLPKEEAMQFIIANEDYDRTFYTGFLGELNIDFATFNNTKSDLFVNLRCMNIENDFANIYVGCGITKDSIPEKEFIETVNKSKTMKKVL
ncbi:isochorismate synthase [Flavobacterium swingsii]|uniref:isochorismate synthase n=1 Tax=Flavobacterium swingsii TaxID=498292 RepID=A0A1I0W9G3_9FLAO|nr:chorismate-binding protein [Flavobacterium swingsii]SFA85369.1 isochorismate synthase [Flavobacterium swingsii]